VEPVEPWRQWTWSVEQEGFKPASAGLTLCVVVGSIPGYLTRKRLAMSVSPTATFLLSSGNYACPARS
jgi:hypothetical protein